MLFFAAFLFLFRHLIQKHVEEVKIIQHNELLQQIKLGDKKAQFEIYKLYYKAMYNTALRIVNSKIEAEDLMQEAFISAFLNIDTYKGEVSFGAWLKKIVVNKSLDFLKKKRVKFDELKEKYDFVEQESFSFEESINEQVEKIKQAMTKLPDGFRVVFSLYLLEGYDHSEIAEILGITASASRSQFTRAKQKLVSILNENK